MKVEQLEAFLRSASCFAVLSDDQLESLVNRVGIRSYQLGEVVVRQGDVGTEMFLVYSGKVRVLQSDNGDEIPLNTLYPGEHFGELALMHGQPRNATIRAAGDSTLVAVPADAVQALLEANADLRGYFENYADRISLWNFIKLVDRFGAQLRRDQLRQLVDQFSLREFSAGEQVLTEGDPVDCFYLIQSGRVEAASEGTPHATLAEGDSFGAAPLVEDPPGVSRWTVTTLTETKLLALSAEHFRSLLAEVPSLRAYFVEQLAHYVADDAAAHFSGISHLQSRESQPRSASVTSPGEAPDAGQPPVDEVSPLPDTAQDAGSDREPAPPALPKIEAETVSESDPAASRALGFWQRLWFPYSPQHDETDCGAACLSMISSHDRHPVGVSRFRDLAGVTAQGASLSQLAEAAHHVGYKTRVLELSPDRLDRLRQPAVLFWKGYHYVVLYGLTSEHAWIADPAVGKLRLDRATLAHDFSGYALELEPTGAAATIRTRDSAASYLWDLLRSRWLMLAGIIAAILVMKICEYAFVKFTETLVDQLQPHQGLASFHNMLALVVLATALQIGLSFWQSLAAVRLGNQLDRAMLGRFFDHLLALPTNFFKLRRIGDIMARFADNAKVRALFTGGALTVIIELPASVFWFYMMFNRNFELSLVVLAFVPLSVIFTLWSSPIMKRYMRRVIEDGAAEQSSLIETVQGIDLVKSMAVEKPFHAKWQVLFEKSLSSNYRYQRVLQVFSAVGGSLQTLSTLALLWYGAVLVNRGPEVLTIGELVAFTMLAPLAISPIMSLIGLWDELQEAKVSLERLSDVLDSEPEPQLPPDKRVYPHRITGRIRFSDVYFKYGGRNSSYVLRNVDFEIRPGQCVAIVGRSGCGKTTLARLLLGLYQPSEGYIEVDRWNLAQLDLETFRQQVGVVTQENLLFSGTIRQNIALGEERPDEELLREAVHLAGVEEFVGAMPLGFDTVVGEFGLTLSGGQRQRIALARAIYRNPRILVLDEATSALDSLSEREIQKNMDAILRDRTAVIIAHKIATIRNADMILVLHEGRIVERGTHDELFAKRGTYYYLAAQQLNL